jgi:four helix bundle protein
LADWLIGRGELQPLRSSPRVRSRFRDLSAYELAASLANDLHRAIAAWPSFDRWSVGMQLMRASDSIGANIAESSGRWHWKDKRRFLVVARGSLYETEHWMAQAEARGLLPDGSTSELAPLARALSSQINKAPSG